MECSQLHVGRSSQDILDTVNAALNKERSYSIAERLISLCEALHSVAARERSMVVPAYTNGVQALPNKYALHLLAFRDAFLREVARLRECVFRYDCCPMGSGVLNGTSWPLNRTVMSKLLGFQAPVANTFDAGQLCGNTFPCEIASVVAQVMNLVTNFLADFMTQYSQAKPWMTLHLGGSTYISSAMPQKRNPGFINDCRRDAAVVSSAAIGFLMRTHNCQVGMPDGRDEDLMTEFHRDALTVLDNFTATVSGIRVNQERALEEINSDWSCTQEIADHLARLGVDFRTAHRFVSSLVTCARKKGRTPPTTTREEVAAMWSGKFPGKGFPLSEEEFRACFDPVSIVEGRRVAGGSQDSEIGRQLYSNASVMMERVNVRLFSENDAAVRETLDKELRARGLRGESGEEKEAPQDQTAVS